MDTSSLMEQMPSSDNLNRIYLQAARNKVAKGVDEYIDLKKHLEKKSEIINGRLRNKKYEPRRVRSTEMPKPDGGVRNLGISTVTDKFVQQAIVQVLTQPTSNNS